MRSRFAVIIREAVAATPGAVGGAFAADDGETVDAFHIHLSRDPHQQEEWALLTAHYGVLFSHVRSALHTWHYGDVEIVVLSHADLDVVVHSVRDGYYALLAVNRPAPLGLAMRAIARAADALREEMS